MTDLHALLKQSIIDRGISDPRDREEIYTEARRAVVRRLWQQDPPLDQDEIDGRINAYDHAVSVIESDFAAHFSGARELQYADPAAGSAEDGHPRPDSDQPFDRPVPMRARYADDPALQPHADDEGATSEEPDEAGDGAFFQDPADEGEVTADEPSFSDEDEAYQSERDEPPAQELEAPLGYDPKAAGEFYDYDDEEQGYQAPPQGDRWTVPSDDSTVRPREPLPKGTREKPRKASRGTAVRMLAGAIVTLVVVLAGIVAFVFLREPAEDGVTIAIEERRQVSDAATAVRIAADDLAVSQTFVLFDGLDPTIFDTTTDNPVRFDNDVGGSFARVASASGAAGATIVIGPGLASQLAGQRIRVRVLARSSFDRGALSMRFAYQSGVAISHWQTANLEPDYGEVGILWRVPSQTTSTSGHRLIIEPGIPGDGTGTDIKSVEIDILAP